MPQQFVKNPMDQFEPEKLPVGWPWRLLSVASILFLGSIFVYFGLVFGYGPYLESQIEKADAEIQTLTDAISKEDQEKFIQFYSQLSNLKSLLDGHIFSSKIFPQLEKITNKKVYFNAASIKVESKIMELDGVADSYAVLGEQLEAFNQTKEISRYILNQSQTEEGVVRFKATLYLNDSIIK